MSSSTASTHIKTSSSSSQSKDLYLYEIPSLERRSLCAVLDELNVWPELAVKHMGYSKEDLLEVKRAMQLGNSPSDELITMWGEQNHTITELFILLYRMEQHAAMDSIRNLVDPKYHYLIKTVQPHLSILMSNLKTDRRNLNDRNGNKTNCISEKKLNCQPEMLSNSNNEDSITSYDSKSNLESLNLKNVNEYASTIPQIDYQELADATDNWSSKKILGKGGFGTVFRGKWKNTFFAIKRIEYHGTGTAEANKIQIQQSLNELKYLNSCRHDNILPLYGYSINGKEPCLVYQLMAGSLEQSLTSTEEPPLSCSQRLNIAQGTARGLQYLHTFREKPLIHGDIKPANILLDQCNQPKIGDFGLAREGPNALNSSMEVSRVYGTKPYLPVEFLGYKSLSTKVDTYSFGVVLLELVTGLRAYDKFRQHKFLTRHVLAVGDDEALMDKKLTITPEAVKICRNLISLGKICIAEKPEQRPEMVLVLWHLEDK